MSAVKVIDIIQNPAGYSNNDKEIAAITYDKMNAVLGENDSLQAKLDEVFWSKILTINPTPDSPVSDTLEKALLNREGQLLKELGVDEMAAHRSALPVGESEPRIDKTITVGPTINGHDHLIIDTGMYAAPGEIVTMRIPRSFGNRGISVQIGHLRTDTGDSNYYTMPYQVLNFEIRAGSRGVVVLRVASPHGGLISFNVPSGAELVGDQSVQIEGAVEAPYFVLGETTNAEWVAGIRDRDVPVWCVGE